MTDLSEEEQHWRIRADRAKATSHSMRDKAITLPEVLEIFGLLANDTECRPWNELDREICIFYDSSDRTRHGAATHEQSCQSLLTEQGSQIGEFVLLSENGKNKLCSDGRWIAQATQSVLMQSSISQSKTSADGIVKSVGIRNQRQWEADTRKRKGHIKHPGRFL
jgi:hypothetical protein